MKKFCKRFDIEIEEKQREMNQNLTERLEALTVKFNSIDHQIFSQKLLTIDERIRCLEDLIPQTNSVKFFSFY